MMIRSNRFNLYLVLLLAVALLPACETDNGQSKLFSTLRLHQEIRAEKADPTVHTETAEVYRANPMKFTVDQNPFLSEGSVKEAKVVEVNGGGFALEIQFDQQGSWLLEEFTSGNPGKHIAILSQFVEPGEQKLNQGRWLAAPQIHHHITDGRLTFTPDATREEAEHIAAGLNHVSQRLATGKDVKW